jgi:hypothetical protein
VIIATKGFNNDREMESFVCEMMLKTIVFGFEQCSIKRLDLEIRRIGIEYVCVMAQTVAPTLSILGLEFEEPTEEEDEELDLDCYEVLEVFFSRCIHIRALRLEFFDFGDDPSFLNPTIKDGFGRLKSLLLDGCRGDLMMFAEHIPIQNLSNIGFDMREGIEASVASLIISVIAMKCRLLKGIVFFAHFMSWDNIHKIAEYCRDLEEITIVDFSRHRQPLNNSEFVAIASLPLLKSLNLTNCWIDGGAVPPLARCNRLTNLRGANVVE